MGNLHGVAGAEAIEPYFRLMTANGATRVYHAVRRLGILQALPADAAGVAKACGLQPEPLGLFLEVLSALGIVEFIGGQYRPTAAGRFLSGAYQDLGDLYWEHLSEFLKTSVPCTITDDAARSEAFYQGQAAALEWMLRPAAEAAADLLATTRHAIILDVGSGSAVWSLAIARRDPATRVTAIDWPAVLTAARVSAQRAGLADRFTTIAGNYHEVDLPEGAYDLAIAANVTHLETADSNSTLFRKLHRALRPEGALAVIDVLPGQPEGDLARTLYALGLALRTKRGRVHLAAELNDLLRQSGFSEGTLHPLRVSPYTMGVLLARKG
ncbi:MAG: class I SAM-dependent methyltransferase [Planctomycetes bacterium]|nr:class I SAM-dependent methyltransferase [Planctomycetota bacterium]